MDRKAKIVVTIGPACESEEKLEQLMKAGMNVARLNFSHGDREQHTEYIARIRRVSERLGMSVGILQDLQGPKIRVGDLPKPLFLKPGEAIRLYAQEDPKPDCAEQVVPVDFPEFFESVHIEDRLLLDDGRLALSVVSAAERMITASVVVGGTLFPHKGINLPGVRLRIPGFTDKDEIDLAFGLERAVDAVAISFVRSVKDVIAVRQAMKRLKKDQREPLLIAKLERPEALDDLEKILEEVDGVMVARGDLGVEMPPERVPVIQKHIIQEANQRAKLVITATQMLELMIQSPLPTRAEASDVANAIFDGSDAVMLSGETASGEYPVEAVQMMDRIIREAETHFLEWGQQQGRIALGGSDAASMAHAAHELARDRDVTAVAVFTNTGRTAWLMSKVRPRSPILAFTPDPETSLRLTFLWGVRPQLVPFAKSLEEMIYHVDHAITESGVVQAGQQVVLVCGFPIDAMRPPNMALLHTVGE